MALWLSLLCLSSSVAAFTNNNNNIHTINEQQWQRQQQRQSFRRSCCCCYVRKVCILDQDEYYHDHDYAETEEPISDVLDRLEQELSLPRYNYETNRTRSNDRDCDEPPLFTHGLCVVPYESTYAIAIQSYPSGRSSNNKKRPNKKKTRNKIRPTVPFLIDFCPPTHSRLGKRFNGQSGTTDLLVKAVAPGRIVRKEEVPMWPVVDDNRDTAKHTSTRGAYVLDLTAGFGQDSVILAQSGASNVHMVERDPIVATLLQDALRRLKRTAQPKKSANSESSNEKDDMDRAHRAFELYQKLSFEFGQGSDVLSYHMFQESNCTSNSKRQRQQPDVCYLDPMFPPRQKSAAVKKNMQILHDILDTQLQVDNDDNTAIEEEQQKEEEDLLEAAYRAARVRVVVKRPIAALPLGRLNNRRPSYDIRGKVNRWDVYVK